MKIRVEPQFSIPDMDLMIAKVFRVSINLKTKTFLTQFLIISQHWFETTIKGGVITHWSTTGWYVYHSFCKKLEIFLSEYVCRHGKLFFVQKKNNQFGWGNTYFEELKILNQDLLLWVNKLHVKYA